MALATSGGHNDAAVLVDKTPAASTDSTNAIDPRVMDAFKLIDKNSDGACSKVCRLV